MPKKKIGKHLRFYMYCIQNESMPTTGLCRASEDKLISSKILEEYIKPDSVDRELLWKERKDRSYWGSDEWGFGLYQFTTLRQTIVLFMAAIAGEL